MHHQTKPTVCRATIVAKDSAKVGSNVQTIDDQAKSLTDASNQEKPFNLDYISSTLMSFRSCPLAKDPESYLA